MQRVSLGLLSAWTVCLRARQYLAGQAQQAAARPRQPVRVRPKQCGLLRCLFAFAAPGLCPTRPARRAQGEPLARLGALAYLLAVHALLLACELGHRRRLLPA